MSDHKEEFSKVNKNGLDYLKIKVLQMTIKDKINVAEIFLM